ncbi:DUF2946 domain-containing protein [Pseudomonas panipatensis]|uniref:DUF2946 domain-containing protein n=1 Tax=Pseudomonas panipatensis TaxID=428992 RepID=A0A1G8DUE5_9PSED|nr:DUF2946 domain-containing protein [Pseudomonas panipatensis]SDH61201.1 Protein of unknown function [Pseudomonas panipatensis]SMP39683.1 Protein of unknown function [Pseudomonas panipatensis]
MSVLRRQGNRQGSAIWLALFAMLMIQVGPLLSQSLPMQPATQVMHGLEELACSAEQRAVAHQDQDAAQRAPFSAEHFMEKCAYCGLLIHSPALEAASLALPADLPGAEAAPSAVLAQRTPASPVFPGARSRAPPVPIV